MLSNIMILNDAMEGGKVCKFFLLILDFYLTFARIYIYIYIYIFSWDLTNFLRVE